MARIGHTSRLLLVAVAVLVCPGVVAQTDEFPYCRPRAWLAGHLVAGFEPEVSADRASDILAVFDIQVTRVVEFPWGVVAALCIPIGEEYTLPDELLAFSEVRYANRTSYLGAPEAPRCECCICGFDCVSPYLPRPPCEGDCDFDADDDRFSDYCDICTDTDGDGLGNPEYEYNRAGFRTSVCPPDNCPNTYNPEQLDLDADGIGDACDRKVTICHNPPGRPARAHTIEIAERALAAHVAHGDVPGPCTTKQSWSRQPPN